MSIDTRLREGLDRAMSAIETDADQHLEKAVRAGRRRAVIHRLYIATVVAAVVAAVAIAGPGILDVIRSQRPRPAAQPPVLPITGSYTVRITERDAVRAGASGAQGTWLLTLSGDGQLDLSSLTNGDIGRSTTQYSIEQNEILTTALEEMCAGVGRYLWSRAGSNITFTPESDPCSFRVAILSSHPWRAT